MTDVRTSSGRVEIGSDHVLQGRARSDRHSLDSVELAVGPVTGRLAEVSEPCLPSGAMIREGHGIDASASVSAFVRGGEFEVIKGDCKPNRLVLFKFPNRRAIRNFFADPDYAKIAAIRFKTSKTIAVAVDGLE